MPAATSAPKATTRMMSVRGTENSPARFRSSKNPAWTSLPVLVAERPDVEVGIRLLHLVDAVDDGIDDVRGVVRIAAELEPDERGMPVGRNLALVAGFERGLHLGDCVERSDSGDDRLHGPRELGLGGRQRAALNEDGLAAGLTEVLVQNLVHPTRLAGPGGLEDDRLHRGDHADREQGDGEPQPAEDRRLAVMGAPPRHPERDVRPLARWPLLRVGLGLVLDDPCLHEASLEVGCQSSLTASDRLGKAGDLPFDGRFSGVFRNGGRAALRAPGATRCPSKAGRACRRCWRRTSRPPGA